MARNKPQHKRGKPEHPRWAQVQGDRSEQARPRRHFGAAFVAFGLGVSLTALAFTSMLPSSVAPQGVAAIPIAESSKSQLLQSLDALTELAEFAPDELGSADIAKMNLLAARGLPGSEDLDVDEALAELDRWAKHVKFETDRHLYRFRRDPAEYENSEAYFRMLFLIVALQGDLGVKYNPERIDEPDFTNSKDLFIHGMVGSDNGGTCVSMPALYVAIGRRLGYPMHLVVTKGHVFARWDDGRERFNIEGTNRGLNTPDDEYYKNWPFKLTEAEINNGWYLRSLTSAEELAVFLTHRGHCLEDIGRLDEAQVAYAMANRLAPKSGAIAHLGETLRSNTLARSGRSSTVVQSDRHRNEWLKRQKQLTDSHLERVFREQERRYRDPRPLGPNGPPLPQPMQPYIPGQPPGHPGQFDREFND